MEALAARDIQAIDAALSSGGCGLFKGVDEIVEASKARRRSWRGTGQERGRRLDRGHGQGRRPFGRGRRGAAEVRRGRKRKVDVTEGRAALDAADAACAKRKADEAARSRRAALTILAGRPAVDELRALDEADAAFVRRSADEYNGVGCARRELPHKAR